MFGELRDVVKDKFVRVAENVQILLGVVGGNGTHNLSLCVFELSVTSEFLSLLLVGELICHLSSKALS